MAPNFFRPVRKSTLDVTTFTNLSYLPRAAVSEEACIAVSHNIHDNANENNDTDTHYLLPLEVLQKSNGSTPVSKKIRWLFTRTAVGNEHVVVIKVQRNFNAV